MALAVENTMNKNNIWWKLADVAYWLSILGFLGWLSIRFGDWKPPMFILIGVLIIGYLPNLYLFAFSLWHWKYRYRGSHPMAWAALFPLFWCFFPSFFYFGIHIKMDRENKKQYSTEVPPFKPTPKFYNILRSVLFVIGGALVGWAALAILMISITNLVIFNRYDKAVAHNIGKVLTANDVQSFHDMYILYQVHIGVMCAITLCCAIGSALLLMSGSLRWRLREQNESSIN